MTITQLLLQIKYRFRDYFIPVDEHGKTGSLVGMEDLIYDYIENNYTMKIDFKINKLKIIALNNLLSKYDSVDINSVQREKKSTFSLRLELRHIFIKKTLSATSDKDFKMKLPYYLAEELLDVLMEYCIADKGSYVTGLDQLKNELHQKLI